MRQVYPAATRAEGAGLPATLDSPTYLIGSPPQLDAVGPTKSKRPKESVSRWAGAAGSPASSHRPSSIRAIHPHRPSTPPRTSSYHLTCLSFFALESSLVLGYHSPVLRHPSSQSRIVSQQGTPSLTCAANLLRDSPLLKRSELHEVDFIPSTPRLRACYRFEDSRFNELFRIGLYTLCERPQSLKDQKGLLRLPE